MTMRTWASGILSAALAASAAGKAAEDEGAVSKVPETLTPAAVQAVERGIQFLVKAQRPDGSFGSDGGGGSYPMTMTALAGIALLAHGSTPTKGPEAKNVRDAIQWVLKSQQATGLYAVAQESAEGRPMYGHGFAMLFLSQAYGVEGDTELARRIQRSLTLAVALSARAQSSQGGWNYGPDPSGDEGSVTVTQVHALRAVANAGIKVPKRTLDMSVAYVEGSQANNPDGGISYRRGDRGSRPAISAAGLTSLLSAGRYGAPSTRKLIDYLQTTFLRGGGGIGPRNQAFMASGHYFYTQYYLGQGMWLAGDEYWREYFVGAGGRGGARDELLRNQQGNGSWQGENGAVYGTAMTVTVFQLPYNYLPIFQR